VLTDFQWGTFHLDEKSPFREPTFLRLGNIWLTINGGGGPTDDKAEVVASPARNPNVFEHLFKPSRNGHQTRLSAMMHAVALLGAAIWSLGEALIPKEKPTIEP
jgi:hypothetical protein